MIDALIAGKLHSKPIQRTGHYSKPFVTCLVRVATETDALFVSVITFTASAQAALMALNDGDSVALSGSLTPKVYQPKDGSDPRPALDLVAHAVLTAYHVTRKRRAMADEPA